jgi:hypothetical protein
MKKLRPALISLATFAAFLYTVGAPYLSGG